MPSLSMLGTPSSAAVVDSLDLAPVLEGQIILPLGVVQVRVFPGIVQIIEHEVTAISGQVRLIARPL